LSEWPLAVSTPDGAVAVSALDCVPSSPVHTRFWRALFANMGINLESPGVTAPGQPKKKAPSLLLNGPPESKP
jgi:hypothetical protein